LAVFVSQEAHYSFQKAVNLLGIGSRFLYAVPSDDQGRMLPDQLLQCLEQSKQRGERPFFIGATAGTTVLGAFDPLPPIAQIAQEWGLWLHVDGAWGGSVLFSERHRLLLEGLELADSFCWDAHKMLWTGLISSFFHCKHPQSLRQSNDGGGSEYIFHESEVASYDLGPSSLQCGRRADIFKVWFHWQAMGTEGIANQVNELMSFAQSAHELLTSEPRIKLLHPVPLLNLCFQCLPDPALGINDIEVINQYQEFCRQELIRRGNFFVNISRRQGLTFFRLILTNPQTKIDHIKSLVHELHYIGHHFNREQQ
jgi:glutamate decarboxylase/sulfinoalanine decarboxylase